MLTVIDSLILACGETEELIKARVRLVHLLDTLGSDEFDLALAAYTLKSVRELLEEAKAKLEEVGCLDAYRVEDALAELDSVIGPWEDTG